MVHQQFRAMAATATGQCRFIKQIDNLRSPTSGCGYGLEFPGTAVTAADSDSCHQGCQVLPLTAAITAR